MAERLDPALHVKTFNPGDVQSILVDAVNPALGAKVDAAGNQYAVVSATDLDIRDLTAATDSVEAKQATHDNLNANANIQVGDADVSNANPVPVSDAGGSLTVDATDFDIRDLVAATDSVAAHLKDGAGVAITSTLVGAKQALDVALKDENGNALGSAMYPIATSVSPNLQGIQINQYEEEIDVASQASASNTYTVPTGKVFFFQQYSASATGYMKAKVEYSLDGIAFLGAFTGFNSPANPEISKVLAAPIEIPAGGKVRITVTNKEGSLVIPKPNDLFSTISGSEVTV